LHVPTTVTNALSIPRLDSIAVPKGGTDAPRRYLEHSRIRYRVLDGWLSPGRGEHGTSAMGQPLRALDAPSEVLDPALFSDTFDASPEAGSSQPWPHPLCRPGIRQLVRYPAHPRLPADTHPTDFRMSPDSPRLRSCRNSGDTARISNGIPV